MTVKAPSRLSDLVLSLSHASFRRRLPYAPRQMHQAVARPPQSRTASVPGLSNEYLHALYEDLMTLDPSTIRTAQPGVDLQQFEHSQKEAELLHTSSPVFDNIPSHTTELEISNDALLAEYAKQGNTRDFESFISRIPSGMSPSFLM